MTEYNYFYKGDTKLTPMQHQTECVEEVWPHYEGIVHLPTGSGKTAIQSMLAKRCLIHSNHKAPVVVVVSPYILLSNQIFSEVGNDIIRSGIESKFLLVHSERVSDDMLAMVRYDMDQDFHQDFSTTSCKVVYETYENALSCEVPLVIFATYDSLERVKQAGVKIDLLMCDEAHYLVSLDNNWIIDEDYNGFPADRKYYFTATLKYTQSDSGRGMNNEERFGPVLYSKSPFDMIMSGVIIRPRMHLIMTETSLDNIITHANAICQAFSEQRSISNIGCKMLVTTSGEVQAQELLHSETIQRFIKSRRNLKLFCITSRGGATMHSYKGVQNYRNKKEFLSALQELDTSDDAIIFHIKMLAEGLDVPGITCVLPLTDMSIGSFMQTLGRATRFTSFDRERIFNKDLAIEDLDLYEKPYAWVIIPHYMGNDLTENFRNFVYALRQYGFNPVEDVLIRTSKGYEPQPLSSDYLDELQLDFKDQFVSFTNEIENEIEANTFKMERFKLQQEINCETIDQTIARFKRENLSKLDEIVWTMALDKVYSYTASELVKSSKIKEGDKPILQTPIEVCKKMTKSLQLDSNKTVLVVHNPELLKTVGEELDWGMANVWFWSPYKWVNKLAKSWGVNDFSQLLKDNGYDGSYKYLDQSVSDIMKFDCILANPPYNPNTIWKKFVQWQMNQLSENGTMVTVHPSAWRESSTHKKLCKQLLEGISELHICDYELFKENKVGIKTDWYVYQNSGSNKITIHYPNNDVRNYKNAPIPLLRFVPDSIPGRILSKITSDKNNGCIFAKGFDPLYKKPGTTFKQCGGQGNNVGWVNGNFFYTDEPSLHQYDDKVVISYTGRPRAKFFNGADEVGVVCAYYWLTDNPFYCTLLNSNMLWKLHLEIQCTKPWVNNDNPLRMQAWFQSSLNFDGLTAQTEEELYDHYGLTEDEKKWCRS